MPRHVKPEGLAFIAWLAALGQALGYHTREEWEILDPAGSTYVDLAWLRRPDDDVALFAFEVESRPASQLAENAAKILTVPTAQVPKPLFFFHVVLKGGGGRPGRAGRAHEAANYGIYALATPGESDRLLADIFAQSARVCRATDAERAWDVLADSAVTSLTLGDTLDVLERHSSADWTRVYARVGLTDQRGVDRLIIRLLPSLSGQHIEGGDYGTYWGNQWSEPLHLGLIARQLPDRAEEAFDRLRRWQKNGDSLTMIGPHFGLSREYDKFVVFGASLLLAVVACLFADVDGAPAWVLEQIGSITFAENMRYEGFINTATWQLYLASAFELSSSFSDVADHLNDFGGGAPTYMAFLPFLGFEPDDGQGWDNFRQSLGTKRTHITQSVVSEWLVDRQNPVTPVAAALLLLTREGAEQIVTDGILAWLARQ
jgi:hypothetical protein